MATGSAFPPGNDVEDGRFSACAELTSATGFDYNEAVLFRGKEGQGEDSRPLESAASPVKKGDGDCSGCGDGKTDEEEGASEQGTLDLSRGAIASVASPSSQQTGLRRRSRGD